MLEGTMFFILGVAVVAFLLILITPFIWRRMLFFARKAVAINSPTSLKQLQKDNEFLKMQHAAQIARQEEKIKLLTQINDEQKIQLAKNREYLEKLEQLTYENKDIKHELVQYKKNIYKDQKDIEQLISNQNINSNQVRELYFSEKLSKVDIASYSQELNKIKHQLDILTKKYLSLADHIQV